MKRLPPIFVLFLLACACLSSDPSETALDWLNRFRALHELPALAPDPVLERTASAYARLLAASGRLAHRDARGRTALDRYRLEGGSAARVGEILGAGPGPGAVMAAWESSPAHAATALRSAWTHAGAGRAVADGRTAGLIEVWVVLFAEQRVEGFALRSEPRGGYELSGTFRDPQAARPVLLSGLEPLEPAFWDPGSREFLFHLPESAAALYHRLGYRTSAEEIVIVSAFFPERVLAQPLSTSSPETAPR